MARKTLKRMPIRSCVEDQRLHEQTYFFRAAVSDLLRKALRGTASKTTRRPLDSYKSGALGRKYATARRSSRWELVGGPDETV
jgi:hypothetical protein